MHNFYLFGKTNRFFFYRIYICCQVVVAQNNSHAAVGPGCWFIKDFYIGIVVFEHLSHAIVLSTSSFFGRKYYGRSANPQKLYRRNGKSQDSPGCNSNSL